MLPYTLPDKLNSDDEYLQYMENIAYLNIDISHSENKKKFFTRINEIEGTNLHYPLMLCIRKPVTYPGTRDSLFEALNFDVWILKSVGKGDAKKMNEIIAECKQIADAIISKIEKDSLPKPGGFWPFTYFKINEHMQQAIDEPLFGDKLVGYSIEFAIGNQKRFEYDETKWRG